MLDCLILGDSIAVGVGQARPNCMTTARVGITSGAYLQTLYPAIPKSADQIVISLGVNDDAGTDTPANLRRLRRGIIAGRVTWLLPGLKEDIRRHIRTIAAENGDRVVDTITQVGPDRLHPGMDGYRQIASWTQTTPPPASSPPSPTPTRRAAGPLLIPMPGSTMPGSTSSAPMPQFQTPGAIYGAWPVSTPFAIPSRDYAVRASPLALQHVPPTIASPRHTAN